MNKLDVPDLQDHYATPQERAARVKRVRNLANLSRKEMCDCESLNVNTYKGWELARYGGLPREGAFKIVERVAREGVLCTVDWLLYGSGSGPQLQLGLSNTSGANIQQTQEKVLNESQAIQNEIIYFSKQFENTVSLKLSDNSMKPFYQSGDYVAGIKIDPAEFINAVGENCIVGLKSGEVLCRNLRRGYENKYQLACLNLETDIDKPVLYDVELMFVAPILWHRKLSGNSLVKPPTMAMA